MGSPGPPLSLMTCGENSKDSAYSHNWIKIYYSKRTHSEFSKRKRDTGWSLGVLDTSLGKSPFRELYRMPFIPPATSYDNTDKQLPPWKAHPSLGAKHFSLGAGLLNTTCLAGTATSDHQKESRSPSSTILLVQKI